MGRRFPPDQQDNETVARQNRELTILNAIAQALNREVDLSRSLQTVLAKVAELLHLDTGWIWLFDEETGKSYLAASQNLPPALADFPYRMEGRCYCLDTFLAGDMGGAANVNVVRCSRLKWLEDETYGLKYHASVPLYAQDQKLGVLNVASTGWRELSSGDLRLLYTVGDLLSIAIARARLFDTSARSGAIRERNRLARELHDTLAQGLSAIALNLETADALLDDEFTREQVREPLQRALDLTRKNLEEARRSVLDLRAAPLEGRSLAEALNELVEAINAETAGRPHINIDMTGAHRPLAPRIEIGLFRIAEEALRNIRRHAQAQQASIRLFTTPEHAQLVVQDDGQGFEAEAVSSNRFGLIGMNERANLLGGKLIVNSEKNGGTRITVRVPLK